ncbi:YggS family pyridoxal phosphate-dependent enzyme [bacterium SCSIO 12643]|nr:YggS family pyridoxal phosphate-dependent enzyme [bacterium SCSIO 12643]
MKIAENLEKIGKTIPENVTLIAVSKTKPNEAIQEAYDAGQRVFGENKALELRDKHNDLPKDIEWHMIGRMQTNKVKYIAPFVNLIHSVDSERLIAEIDKRAKNNDRVIDVLIQVHIAREDSKTGFLFSDAFDIMKEGLFNKYENVNIRGFMGMGTNTFIDSVVEEEFGKLHNLFLACQEFKSDFDILSMGMSNDYELAIKNGSNMVRIGSSIFGARDYSKK